MASIKTILVVLLIFLAVFFGFRLLSPEDTWDCKQGQWQQHGHPKSPMPTTPCNTITVTPLSK